MAPMPGMVSAVNVGVGHRVKEGEPLITLEAMKMLTTIYAASDGVVAMILVKVGEAVETDDLLVRREAE